jgi:hypothetical protein
LILEFESPLSLRQPIYCGPNLRCCAYQALAESSYDGSFWLKLLLLPWGCELCMQCHLKPLFPEWFMPPGGQHVFAGRKVMLEDGLTRAVHVGED